MPSRLFSWATSVCLCLGLVWASDIFAKCRADNWNRDSHPMKKNDFGVFEITLPPNPNGEAAIPHNSKIKVGYSDLIFMHNKI